jgi:hypothetical protein
MNLPLYAHGIAGWSGLLRGEIAPKLLQVKGGTVSVYEDTIGSAISPRKGECKEIGIWTVYAF